MEQILFARPTSLRLVGSAALLVLAAGLAQAQGSGTTSTGSSMTQGSGTSAAMGHGSDQMHKSMMSGMEHMQKMPMSGDTDKDFATMMKMHHQQAIEMAQAEVQHGKSPEMKALAKKIIDEQKKEIAQFDKFLQKKP